jgi:protein-tyrosine phosphatase
MIRVCFVCLGNICRSPTAHGIMEDMVARAGLGDHIEVHSAGTSAYHIGELPDGRSRATARSHGVELTSRARQFEAADFGRFDYVLAMDENNHRELLRMAPKKAKDRVFLFRSFDPSSPQGAGVPDPYYGGDSGFENVFQICVAGCRGLLATIEREHGASFGRG